MGLAIDYQREDEMYIITAEIAKLPKESSETASPLILTGRGRKLTSALKDIELQTSGILYYQHAVLMVFGEEMLRVGIQPIVSHFMQPASVQKTMQTAAVKNGKGADLFTVKANTEDFLSKELVQVIKKKCHKHEGELYLLYNDIPAGEVDKLPLIAIEQKGDDKKAKLDGFIEVKHGTVQQS